MWMTCLSGLYTNSASPRGLPRWLTSLCTTMKSHPRRCRGSCRGGNKTNQPRTSEARLPGLPSREVLKLGCMAVSPLCCLPSKTACLLVKGRSGGQTGIGFLGQVPDSLHTWRSQPVMSLPFWKSVPHTLARSVCLSVQTEEPWQQNWRGLARIPQNFCLKLFCCILH